VVWENGALSYEKDLARNRAAYHDYVIGETLEAGLVLTGTEVKALRDGACNLKDAYARVKDGEVFLFNCHISPYTHGSAFNHEPLRPRKLLLHRREILRLRQEQDMAGQSLIPLRVYLKEGRIKIEIGVGKGKKLHDKREAKRRETLRREADSAVRSHARRRS
jgi:SsrA-binding protein